MPNLNFCFTKKQCSLAGWLPVIFWMAVIFYFSDQPDLKSGLPGDWDFILRKLAHITEYFILTLLLARALAGEKISKSRALIFAGLAALLYAVSDEIHQLFVFGREGSVKDVVIDGVGIIIALFFKK